MLSSCDLVVRGGHLATMSPHVAGDFGAVEDGALAVQDGRIVWLGSAEDAPADIFGDPAETIDLEGGWATPGLIDVHTHLVFGGTRADEFALRLEGASYEEIARAGGGILSTVRATRQASMEELVASGAARLARMIDQGLTTVEIKSGYGLDLETEIRMLRAAREIRERSGVTVRGTILGAHAVPPEYRDDRTGFLDMVCDELIPAVVEEGLAHAVDAFCESIAFSVEECERVLHAGAERGLSLRLHADQLEDGGGAALAARMGARSADHLEHASEEGVAAMAAAGTAAVLLPGAYLTLRETSPPPVDAMRREGVAMVVATDLNPGTSPLVSPLLAMNLACTLFRLTPEEALAGMTRRAAPVLGLEDRGRLEPGLRADIACWTMESPAELAYWMGANPCRAVICGGVRLR